MTEDGAEAGKEAGAARKPVHVERVGWIQASVWARQGKKGTYHELSLRRAYLGTDNRIRYSGSFHPRDLADVKLVLERAGEVLRAMSASSGPSPARGESADGATGPGSSRGSEQSESGTP